MQEKERMAKGRLMKGYLKYIKKKWGNDGVDRCRNDLGIRDEKILDDSWYPEEINGKLLHWIADNYGESHVEDAAAFTVTQSGLIAFAAKIVGIEKVLERGVDDYYRSFNFGDIKIDVEGKQALVRLTDSTADLIDCLSWRGAFKGIFNLVGKKGTIKEIECTYKGGRYCEFLMEWD